jgi:hypothetical protein
MARAPFKKIILVGNRANDGVLLVPYLDKQADRIVEKDYVVDLTKED